MEKPGIKNSGIYTTPLFWAILDSNSRHIAREFRPITKFCEGSVALRQKNDESEYPNGENM